MAVNDSQVVLDALVPLRPRRVVEESRYVARKAVLEETFLPYGIDKIEIVVEIDKMFGQAGNLVQIAFYHHRIISRQELRRYIILVVHQMQFGVMLVEPCRFLSAGDEMNLPHPRSKLLHATEPVFQETVVAEAGFGYAVLRIVPLAGVLGKIRLPLRIVHVHPRDYKIYIHIYVRAS